MNGLKKSNIEFVDLEKTPLSETKEQKDEEPLPPLDKKKDIDVSIQDKHVAIALHNYVAEKIITGRITEYQALTTISKNNQNKSNTDKLRDELRTSDTDPTIKSIDVLVIEANLRTPDGQVGGEHANPECINIIRETLQKNPNAIIILVTQTSSAAAEILETFKDHHVYYSDNKEMPFSQENSKNFNMLNNRCIKLRPLPKMLLDIATLHKKNMNPNASSNDEEPPENTVASSPRNIENFSSDLSPRKVSSLTTSTLASPKGQLNSVRINVEGAHITQDSQPNSPQSPPTSCCLFPFGKKGRPHKNNRKNHISPV